MEACSRAVTACLRPPCETYCALQVKFSECGERFAAIGEGGVVAAWRVDAPRLADSDTGALGRADWCHQVQDLLHLHTEGVCYRLHASLC